MTYNLFPSFSNLNGNVTSTGSNTARSLAARFSDVINVLDWLTAGHLNHLLYPMLCE